MALPLAVAADSYAQSTGGSTLGRVEAGISQRPVLLAFGDSVAAGYGLGPSGPAAGGASNRNQWTYSRVLADDLGWSDRNFAVEGASAGANGVLAEICRSLGAHSVTSNGRSGCGSEATPISPPPRLITMTVGADDIQFAACMTAALLSETFPNPCAGAELANNLRTLAINLETDLATLRTFYPRVPIILTGYYNPLGDDGSLLPSGCPLVSAAVLTPLLLQRNWLGLLQYAWEWHVAKNGGSSAAPPQNAQVDEDLSAFAGHVVTQLNGTLAQAAMGEPGVHFVQPNFGTRGLCSSSPLVFEPLADASVTVNTPVLGARTIGFHFGTQVCPGPKESLEQMLSRSGSGRVSLLAGQLLAYSYRFSTNCALHPTKQGQAVIAEEIRGLAERLTS